MGTFGGLLAGKFWLVKPASELIKNGRLLQSPKDIEGIELTSMDGKQITKKDFLGHWSVVTFGFTSCPDVCPTAMGYYKQELDLIANSQNSKSGVEFIFVSVDPERDTPEVLKEYLKKFHSQIKGYSGTKEQLEKVAKLLKTFHMKTGDGEDYSISHSPYFYLINPEGQWQAFYTPPVLKGRMADDLISVIEGTKAFF